MKYAKFMISAIIFVSPMSVQAEVFCPDEIQLTSNDLVLTDLAKEIVFEPNFLLCDHVEYILYSPKLSELNENSQLFNDVTSAISEALLKKNVLFDVDMRSNEEEFLLKKRERHVYDAVEGGSLKQLLTRIAANENYNIVWKLPVDYKFEVDTNYVCFSGEFQECTQKVASDFIHNDVSIKFTLYTKNKTLLVEEM